MSSENIEIQYPDSLESFEKEVQRYKPIDMIEFCTEYFECLQKGVPLRCKDLSGLKKFKLTPEDEAVVRRLHIPKEDLVRVINRRKIKSHEEILNELNSEFDKYFELIESNGSLTEEEMHNYLKLKTNAFRDYEFIRFLKEIEKLPISKNHHRIFFTKLYNLTDDEKNLIFKFCDLDYKITNDKKTQSWKEMLILLNDSNKHTYAPYDDITQKIERDIKLHEEKGQNISLDVFDSIFKQYNDIINKIKNYDESQLYNFILKQYHYKRVIIYDILKAKVLGNSPDKSEIENLYNLYDKIFFKSFAYLTDLDYYDFILSCFIPLIKESDKTSLEHREMESYLNHLIPKIPQIYNINFEEEKNVYYNIECVKYFLNKQNNINTDQFKKIFIQIIQIFTQKVKDLKKELNLQTNNEILKMFKTKYELIQLQYNEFYPKLVEFTDKMVKIAIKYDLSEKSNKEIENALISQFKSNEKLDQILITNSMMMIEMFESDSVKQKGINDTIIALVKAMSIPEMALEIREHEERDKEIIPKLVMEYYNEILKLPRFDFNKLKYLTFKAQVQICNLIIRNNKNLQNTAIIYQDNNIAPYIDYDYMIEELYNFDLFYLKISFEKSLKEQLEKDFNDLVSKFQKKFPKIDNYIKSLSDEENNKDYIEKFEKMNNFEQKLILTYINFSDDLKQEKKYEQFIETLSVIYLKEKIDFINKEFNINLTQEEKDEKKYNFDNNLYLQSLALELKHVNYLIYIFVKYDRGEDYLVQFNKEEKSIINYIELALNYKNNRIPKDCLSYKEMMSSDDCDNVLKDLELYHPVVYNYIKEFKDDQPKNNLTDFKIFNDQERDLILKILSSQNKNISELKTYQNNTNDKLSRTLKHIMLSEKDTSLNTPENSDLRFYFRKTLLYIEKQMSSSMKECVSLVLDYTYDPNNTYLKSDFLHFSLPEQMILLQDILCRQKILDYHTMYYEQNASAFMEEYLKIYLDICSRWTDNECYHKRLEEDFNYLLKYFNDSLETFIKEIHDVNNQFVYQFLNKFSIDERKAICLFLEFYAALTKKDIYNNFKDRLQTYIEDLSYKDRIKMINNQLDMILNNEIIKSSFMTTAEDIKETAFEINYLIESITTIDDSVNTVEPYLIYLYETFPRELKEITIKTIKCIREQNTNKIIGLYADEFEKNLENSKPSFFISVIQAFDKIDKSLIPNHDNSDKKAKYDKLKLTLNSLCEDLFKFVDDCKIGRFNLRKIKAISKEKVEIIKLVMNCDNLIQPNKKLKDASRTLELVKLD